jgi:hypothetical protein
MKKIFILLCAIIPLIAYNQENQESEIDHSVYVGLNGGVDYNFNGYRLIPDENGFNFFAIDPHLNLGLNIGVMVTKRFRPALEFKYLTMSYGMDWDDYNSIFDETITKLRNFDLSLHLDYFLLLNKKFQIGLSPAIKSEFVFNSKYIRKDLDGDTENVSYNFIDDEYSKSLIGGALSAILKYNVNDRVGITLIPEYTMFFRNFVRDNDKRYQRASVNLGVEFKF